MKTALVLGLALAANAYKTEQVETRVHIKGDNLNFKDLKDLQNLIPHGLKFDDQADDELFRDPYDQDGHRLPHKLGVKYEDELLYRSDYPHLHEHPKDSLPKFHVGEGYKTEGQKNRLGLPKLRFDEETDNEYVSLPQEYIEILKNHKLLIEIHNIRADGELATFPYKDYSHILKSLPKGFIGQEIKQADDEFMALSDQELYHLGTKRGSSKPGPSKLRNPKGGFSGSSNAGPSRQEPSSGEFPKMILGSDNPGLYFLDDELMSRPILQQVANDDELAFWHAPPKEFASDLAFDKAAFALRVDDEVDDELVYLKDLLKTDRHRPVDVALPRENLNLRGGLDRRHTIILP